MLRPITWRDRLRYRFDATLARGTVGVIAWLGLVTLIVVAVAGLAVWFVGLRTNGTDRTGFVEGVWVNLMHALDPGALGADVGWSWRVVALVVTVAGIFVLSILIGIISSGIEARLDELRKGRSLVVEDGHTLVLGWSAKLHQILAELEIANENQSDPVVVVLADRDKVAMEDEIRLWAGRGRRTRVICRSGSPANMSDLEIVRPQATKSVLVLLDDETGDPGVVKAVLALLAIDPELTQLEIVAEFGCEDSAAAIDRATDGKIAVVVSSDVIARVTAQVCRQSGLSAAFQELLDFAGDEIYFHPEPALVGRTFAASLTAYPTSSVIGLRAADGTVQLSPPMERVIATGDQIIAISADDDTIVLGGEIADVSVGYHVARAIEPACEHTLLVGWNDLAATILTELDRYVLAGSTVRILVDPTKLTAPVNLPALDHTYAEVIEADTVNGATLAEHVGARGYDQVILLCYRTGEVAVDDAQTLLTLLQVRQATHLPDSPNAGVRLVTELLDVRDVELARIANPDDFVVSERLTSLMLAQLVENTELRDVFKDLFDAEGVELVLVPAERYCALGTELYFGDVVAAARDQGHVAVGIHLSTDETGVVVNPPKDHVLRLASGDRVLVLA